ncbi:MAG: FHA domain-containing protein [Chloroflexota bacterium]
MSNKRTLHKKPKPGSTKQLTPRAAITMEQRESSAQTPWQAKLLIPQYGVAIPFEVSDGITLGRTFTGTSEFPHMDLSTYAAHKHGVSRRHAVIRMRSDFLSVYDMGSTNGSFLNGYKLMPFVDVPLEDEDVLELGNLKLQVRLIAQVAQGVG